MKVLVVEDDAGLAEMLAKTLSKQRYQVEIAANGEAGWALIEAFEYDLILLDLHLPKLDGISLCRRLRAAGYQIPVLLMTTEDTRESKIVGLDAGADDYVLKPLDLEEVLARIRALLRRGTIESTPMLTWGALTVNPNSCEVFGHEQRLRLTSKEYELLELLLRYPHRIFSVSTLIERLWSFDNIPSDNALRTHVKSLRRKLREGGIENMIETVYGLGYRLTPEPAPLDSATSALAAPEIKSPKAVAAAVPSPKAQPQDRVLEALQEIWQRHQPRYLAVVAGLMQVGQEWLAQGAASSPEMLARAQQEAHTLKGALGSFGLMNASQMAAEIEQLLLSGNQLNPEQVQQLAALMGQLHQALQGSILAAGNPKMAIQPESVIDQWLIIHHEPAFTTELQAQAAIAGIQTSLATTLDEAQYILQYVVPHVVLLDFDCASSLEEGLKMLSALSQQHPAVPVIVTLNQDTLSDRVKILRSGGCTILLKPVTATQVLETVIHCLAKTTLPSARILALDDDPAVLQCLEQLLTPWGFRLTLVANASEFWVSLQQAPPDLIILDIEMPDLNGIELCQIIRSDPTLSQIPVLFLSGHTNPEQVAQVFAAGADDYLSKPIVGSELIARISNRLERVHLLRTLAEVDTLTGLSRRRRSLESLNQLLKLAERQQKPLCLALLDLDQFKQINDQQGHERGDLVLKTFGDYLRQTFRQEDVLARWGGEEFVVGLYGVVKDVAIRRLNVLLQMFSAHRFLGLNNQAFQVSFSGGVAEYPQDGQDIQALYNYADQTLYRAKAAGRKQVL
ncbi:MAG: response regulator [Spirulina sp. SIO3F2]|nr:response regulator [Spirulina sp. SIO3F2]